MSTTQEKRLSRHKRIRAKVIGTAVRPRLAVFRSNMYIYAQLIDDATGKTLVASHDKTVKKGTKIDHARSVGAELAEKAKKAGISEVVFDRGGFIYTGRVAALADAAREGGLVF